MVRESNLCWSLGDSVKLLFKSLLVAGRLIRATLGNRKRQYPWMQNFVYLVCSSDHNYYVVGVAPKTKPRLSWLSSCMHYCCRSGHFSPVCSRLHKQVSVNEKGTKYGSSRRCTHYCWLARYFQWDISSGFWFSSLHMKCCSHMFSLCRDIKWHEIRPTKRTIIVIFHPFHYTFSMKNVITLIRLCPAYSLARFVYI